MEPRTVWEETDGVRSGGSGTVAAAAFEIAGAVRGGVTLTVRVPPGFWRQLDGGGATATLLIDPDEAHGFAGWLDAAAQAAEKTGPRVRPLAERRGTEPGWRHPSGRHPGSAE